MSKWSDTIKFINSFPNENWVITPQKVKENVDGSQESTGIYVNYLHKAGYLKRTGHGVYRRIRVIPTDLTLSKLRAFVYPPGKTWQERKIILERYWKLKDIKEKI